MGRNFKGMLSVVEVEAVTLQDVNMSLKTSLLVEN